MTDHRKNPSSEDSSLPADGTKLAGRILKGVGGNYQILLDSGGEITAKPRGILRKDNSVPYPGDFVDVSFTNDEVTQYNIDHIHERTSFLIRPAIANLDSIILTCSAAEPKPDCFLLDKLIIICIKAGVRPVICITKADLDREEAERIGRQYSLAGLQIFKVGKTDEYLSGFGEMEQWLSGKTVSFAGPSGVGKSTLLNRIMKQHFMNTGAISEKIGKGKHTTRHSQIFACGSGYLADTPGFSSLELQDLDVTGDDVLAGYPEIAESDGECRFADCRHIGEAGCSIDLDRIDPERLSRYRQFRNQMDKIQPYEMKKNRNGVK
jgi:ribosome biogenesis GTPase